jgi:hypothetical protein
MEVTTNVTASLHPQNLLAIDGINDDTRGYIAPAVEAFETAYMGIQKIHEARAAAEKNQAWTPENRQLMIANFAEKHQENITKKFDGAVAGMTKTIEALDAMLNDPVKADAERSSIASEIRAYVKNLTTEQRHDFLRDAHNSGDVETLRAVLGAKPFLSGITEDERQTRTRMLHEKLSPEVANRLKVLRAAREMLLDRGGLVFSEVEKGIGASWDKIQTIRKGQSHADNALKFTA